LKKASWASFMYSSSDISRISASVGTPLNAFFFFAGLFFAAGAALLALACGFGGGRGDGLGFGDFLGHGLFLNGGLGRGFGGNSRLGGRRVFRDRPGRSRFHGSRFGGGQIRRGLGGRGNFLDCGLDLWGLHWRFCYSLLGCGRDHGLGDAFLRGCGYGKRLGRWLLGRRRDGFRGSCPGRGRFGAGFGGRLGGGLPPWR
jgi:hypothetical protein